MSKYFLRFSSLLLVILFAFSACLGGGDDTEDGDASEESTEEVAEEEPEEELADVPEGCPQKTTLAVKSPEAGEVAFDGDHAVYTSWREDYGTIYFANWDDFDKENYSFHDWVDGDVSVSWDLKTTDESPVTAGTWPYRPEDETEPMAITWLNVGTVDLSGAIFDDNASVEITYLGDDYVCGSVTADDGESSLNGEFMVEFLAYSF